MVQLIVEKICDSGTERAGGDERSSQQGRPTG